MKFTKKSLSILLAISLLVCVCTLSAGAAVDPGYGIMLRLRPTANSYSAGDIATFIVSYESLAVANLGSGEIEIAYDNTVFEPIVDLAAGPSLETAGVNYADYALKDAIDSANAFVVTGASQTSVLGPDESANGWNDIMHITMTPDLMKTNEQLYFDCTTERDMFAFQLKIKDGVADGAYTVGFNGYAIDNIGTFFVNSDHADGTIYGGMEYLFDAVGGVTQSFKCEKTTVTVGAPAASTAVANNDVKARFVRKATNDYDFQLGFKGTITDMDIGVAPDYADLTKVTGLGVIFTADATLGADSAAFIQGATGAVDCACETLYLTGTANSYQFRAVMRGVDKTSTATMYYRTYVIYDGQTYYSDIANVNAANVYAAALTAGLVDPA